MTDIWAFLLQTLTLSVTAGLLLLIKRILEDKLSPRWQYGVWSVLLLSALFPANFLGRHGLFDLPLLVEWAKAAVETRLDSAYTSAYSITRALPFPGLPGSLPQSPTDWLFLLYLVGTLLFFLRYLFSYFRLRRLLRRGAAPSAEIMAQVESVALRYGLTSCPAVVAEGLDSAFVCGLFRPLLVLPAGQPVDDKVLLHELLHLKYGDIPLGWLACVLRCLHWCNPFLWKVFDRIGNDCESLCDQRVLERLEGEDRRDYGKILLSMANETYARAPGTSSAANGGANIARRIANIARFKRYPAGMSLVSVCIAAVLAAACLPHTSAAVPQLEESPPLTLTMAAARTNRCTTLAGALDTYAKGILTDQGLYFAMTSAPEQHEALAAAMAADGTVDSGLPGTPFEGYYLFNLNEASQNLYVADLVFPMQLLDSIEGDPYAEKGWLWVASLPVRAFSSQEGWIVEPTGTFTLSRTEASKDSYGILRYGDPTLPAAIVYEGEAADFRMKVSFQTIHTVDNQIQAGESWFFGPSYRFDYTPKPHAEFEEAHQGDSFLLEFTGTDEAWNTISSVAFTAAPADVELEDPVTRSQYSSWSSSNGSFGATFHPAEQGSKSLYGGGGGGYSGGVDGKPITYPEHYVLALLVDSHRETVTLYPVERGAD